MESNKCDYCNKKAGIMPFSCRCDYKKLGKDEILKSNPVIVAKKLDKI